MGEESLRTTRMPRKQRQAQLLSAAQEVFVERGYHATAMDEIAERAGVSKPVLYQHFPGKLELYLAILDRLNADLVNSVTTAVAGVSNNRERVAAAIDAYFEFVDRGGAAFRLVFESDLTNDPLVRDRVDSAGKALSTAIADIISSDTELSRAKAELLGVALSTMAHTSARAWLTSGKSIPRTQAAEMIAQLAWRGIRAFPKREEDGA
ncbi:MAG: TetR/AcrR family transcriptional regulator [Actinomycetales bacterium]